jgi:hypothetical protein
MEVMVGGVSMRYILLAFAVAVVALGVGLTAPERAATATLSGSGFTDVNGVLGGPGTFGGVNGTMTTTVTSGACGVACTGTFTMTVGASRFATGTFSCSGGACTYSGTVVGAKPAKSTFTISTTTTTIMGSVRNHGAWVSSVAHFANSHSRTLSGLGLTNGAFVIGAAHDPGGKTLHHDSASTFDPGTGGGDGHGHEGEGSGHGK